MPRSAMSGAALEAALPMLRTQLAESGIQLDKAASVAKALPTAAKSSSQQQSSRAQHIDAFGAEDDMKQLARRPSGRRSAAMAQ